MLLLKFEAHKGLGFWLVAEAMFGLVTHQSSTCLVSWQSLQQ